MIKNNLNLFTYYLAIPIILILSCQKKSETIDLSNEYKEEEYKSLFDTARYMLPIPEGVFVPQNLRQMNILEMYNYGKRGGTFNTIEFKTASGKTMSFDSIYANNQKVFTQMFANDSGRVVMAVVFDITDEFIKKIKEGYLPSSQSASNQNGELKLKDRFMIPSFPGLYAPKGLRKLNLLEMNDLGESGRTNTPFVLKNEKGEEVSEDYFTSGSGFRYMQIFVDDDSDIKEGVIYDMTDEISALFLLLRFTK